MDEVHDTGIFNKNEGVLINRYHNYIGVHCIRDMVHSDGLTMDSAMLTKDTGQSSRDFPCKYPTGQDHKL
jgi:hypothetical protein